MDEGAWETACEESARVPLNSGRLRLQIFCAWTRVWPMTLPPRVGGIIWQGMKNHPEKYRLQWINSALCR